MSNGRLKQIHARESEQQRRSGLYVIGLVAVVVVVVAALVIAARTIGFTLR